MGKKPLVGWVGLCGIGILMTGCNCCNNPATRQQNFAGGRADASAGWTNKALNRQPQNAVAGNTAGGTDSMSGMSSGMGNAPVNSAGVSNGAWGAGQGMGAGTGAVGGMQTPNGGGMMSPMGTGTPVSYNGSSPQPGGGMGAGANGIPGIPAGARYVGSSSNTGVVQTSGQMSDASAVTNAGGSQPANSVDSGVRPAMAMSSDLNSLPNLPPPPTGGAGSSSGWNGSGATAPPPPPPLPSDPALNNTPPPVTSMSTRGLSGSSTAAPGSANGLGSYLNSKGP
jgi:hypothetical protein